MVWSDLRSGGFNLIGDTGFVTSVDISTGTKLQTNTACIIPTSNDLVGTQTAPLDAGVGPLQDNGGPTMTHALLSGSKALRHGSPTCLATDQRRFGRLGLCDIGAYQLGGYRGVNKAAGLPIDIISNTELTADLRQGVIIRTDNIVFDCKNHKIEGIGAGNGIDLTRRTGVIVRNCQVKHFNNGFNIEDARLNLIQNNLVTNNLNDGFHLLRAAANVFTRNSVATNGDDGIDFQGGTANLFTSNTIQTNTDDGVNANGTSGNLFAGNSLLANRGKGFTLSHSWFNSFVVNSANRSGGPDFEEKSHPNLFRQNVFGTSVGIRSDEMK
jgi:parallel beta-helix repeat protein